MMAACAVGVIALAFVPETAGASIRGREIPTTEIQTIPDGDAEARA